MVEVAREMSEAQSRSLMLWIISGLVAIVGTLGLMLWNNQQEVLKHTNDRLDRMELVLQAMGQSLAALTAIQQRLERSP